MSLGRKLLRGKSYWKWCFIVEVVVGRSVFFIIKGDLDVGSIVVKGLEVRFFVNRVFFSFRVMELNYS